MKTSPPSRNWWPAGIVAALVLYGVSIGVRLAFAVRQDFQLVRPDYYAAEVRHQDQIDREQRTAALGEAVALEFDESLRRLECRLPVAHVAGGAHGVVRMYRPADARLDCQFALEPLVEGGRSLDLSRLEPGLWRVELTWESAGKDFFKSQVLILPARR